MIKNQSIWQIIVVLMLLASCASANKEEISLAEVRDKANASHEVDQQFTAERLARGNLIAFESRAKEKLADFFNYMGLISDPKYDVTFKSHASNLAEELFIDFETKIPTEGQEYLTVQEFIKNHFDAIYGQREFKINSIEVSQQLQPIENKEHYRGVLSFDVSVIAPLNITPTTYKGEIGFSALKVDKSFGKDTRRVWEVLLGEGPMY